MTRQFRGQVFMQVMGKTGAMGVRHRKRNIRLQRLLRTAQDPPTTSLLTRLHSLARERHRAAAGAKLVLDRQERLLQALRRDNEECSADLVVMERRAATQDARDQQRLRDILFEYDVISDHNRRLEAKARQLRGSILQVDGETERCRKLLAKRRGQVKSWGCGAVSTKIKVEVAMQKYDSQINELRKLREKMDSLLITRRSARNDLANLKAEFDDVTSDIAREIDRSSTKLKRIAGFNLKRQQFMEYYNSKKALFDKELSYWDGKIFCSKKLHRFLSVKYEHRGDPRAREKQLQEAVLRARQQKNQAYADMLQQVRSLFPPHPQVGPYEELLGRHRNARMEDRKCERAVQRAAASPLIRAKLGYAKLQEIIKSFIEMMEENFYLFSALSDKQKQLDDLRAEYGQVKKEEVALRARQAQAEEANAKRVEELHRKIVTRTERADKVQKEIEEADQTIQDYITGVLQILRNLGYTEQDIQNFVGPHEKVSERNLGRCIAAIEHHLEKIISSGTCCSFKALERKTSLTSDKGDAAVTILEIKPDPKTVTTSPTHEVSITPPSLSEDEDEDDDQDEDEQFRGEILAFSRPQRKSSRLPPAAEERPLTRDELMKLLRDTTFAS